MNEPQQQQQIVESLVAVMRHKMRALDKSYHLQLITRIFREMFSAVDEAGLYSEFVADSVASVKDSGNLANAVTRSFINGLSMLYKLDKHIMGQVDFARTQIGPSFVDVSIAEIDSKHPELSVLASGAIYLDFCKIASASAFWVAEGLHPELAGAFIMRVFKSILTTPEALWEEIGKTICPCGNEGCTCHIFAKQAHDILTDVRKKFGQ